MQTPAARACTRVPAQRHPRRIAAGFGNSVGTAYAYVTAVTSLLADCAPGLLNPPCASTIQTSSVGRHPCQCGRVGDSRADHSAKHRRHDVNVRVVTDPVGRCCGSRPLCRPPPTA